MANARQTVLGGLVGSGTTLLVSHADILAARAKELPGWVLVGAGGAFCLYVVWVMVVGGLDLLYRKSSADKNSWQIAVALGALFAVLVAVAAPVPVPVVADPHVAALEWAGLLSLTMGATVWANRRYGDGNP